jgi:hypothetical protein
MVGYQNEDACSAEYDFKSSLANVRNVPNTSSIESIAEKNWRLLPIIALIILNCTTNAPLKN